MRRAVLATIAVAAVVALYAGPAVAKPDLRIKVQGDSWIGDNIYSPPSSIALQSPSTSGPGTLIIKVTNEGARIDTIHFDAFVDAENGSFQILYQGVDVSAQIENGQFKLKRMPAGASSKPFTLVHTLGPGGYVETTLSVWSKKKPANVDQVRALSVDL